jgi:hypothetical protein
MLSTHLLGAEELVLPGWQFGRAAPPQRSHERLPVKPAACARASRVEQQRAARVSSKRQRRRAPGRWANPETAQTLGASQAEAPLEASRAPLTEPASPEGTDAQLSSSSGVASQYAKPVAMLAREPSSMMAARRGLLRESPLAASGAPAGCSGSGAGLPLAGGTARSKDRRASLSPRLRVPLAEARVWDESRYRGPRRAAEAPCWHRRERSCLCCSHPGGPHARPRSHRPGAVGRRRPSAPGPAASAHDGRFLWSAGQPGAELAGEWFAVCLLSAARVLGQRIHGGACRQRSALTAGPGACSHAVCRVLAGVRRAWARGCCMRIGGWGAPVMRHCGVPRCCCIVPACCRTAAWLRNQPMFPTPTVVYTARRVDR